MIFSRDSGQHKPDETTNQIRTQHHANQATQFLLDINESLEKHSIPSNSFKTNNSSSFYSIQIDASARNATLDLPPRLRDFQSTTFTQFRPRKPNATGPPIRSHLRRPEPPRMMQDWAHWALETAKRRGATYADARVMDIRQRELGTKNGEVGTLVESETLGIGIRVIASGAWGFASTDRLTREGVQACAAEAVAIAKASALAKRENVALAPEKAYVDTWQNPFLKDPFRIPVERQIDMLIAADKQMLAVKGVTLAEGSMSFKRIDQLFVSSIGSVIHQVKMHAGGGIIATSFAGSEIQKRSYPNSFGGQHSLQGYELIESFDLVGNARRMGEEAVGLHSAAHCPEGTSTIVLGGSQLGLQIHESIGHPIEIDRVLGQEANFAGMSFLTVDKLRKLKYGSDIVNVVADARLDHGPGLGTFAYDDEG